MNNNGRILFSSLKGGVGKSTAACCIASALASFGFKVVLADLDFRSRSLDLMLGVSDRIVFTIDDYMNRRCTSRELLVKVPLPYRRAGVKGELLLCPACSEASLEVFGTYVYSLLGETLERIADECGADYVICDTGADTRVPTIIAESFAETAIVVSEQSRTSIRAGEATAAYLTKCGSIREVRLLINNFDFKAARSGDRAGIIEMIDECAIRCIGVIPSDEELCTSQDHGSLPSESSLAFTAGKNVAARLRGIETPLFSGMKKLRRRAVI